MGVASLELKKKEKKKSACKNMQVSLTPL